MRDIEATALELANARQRVSELEAEFKRLVEAPEEIAPVQPEATTEPA